MRTLHLHLLDARSVTPPAATELAAESWARYQQMTSDKRRLQFLVGRQLLARVASELCGQALPLAAITEGPRGPQLREHDRFMVRDIALAVWASRCDKQWTCAGLP